MRTFWKLAFAVSFMVGVLGARPTLAYGPTDLGHLHPGSATRPPVGWVQFCREYPGDCAAQGFVSAPVDLTAMRWRELDTVNRFFNQSIVPVTDIDQYGTIEKWTYAVTGQGDCEDYVLEKRRRLIQLGWAPSNLLITIVIDQNNGGHAVLTVVTSQGDFVLDNVIDDILSWSKSGLTFIKRQSSLNPNVWIDLGRTIGRPEVVTAATRR